MKIFIIWALCAAAVVAYDATDIADILRRFDPDLKPHAKDCIDEMKLDPKLMDEDNKEAKIPSVEVQSCFIACLDKKMGLVKNDGSYNESWVVLAEDPIELQTKLKTKFDAHIKFCKDTVGTNSCKMSACFHKMPKKFWE